MNRVISNAFLDSDGNLVIENGHILYRNFSGKPSEYNHEGDRNFCVYIEDNDLAQSLHEEGWNVKIKTAKREGEIDTHYVKVNVSYKYAVPKVFRHIGKTCFECDQNNIGEIDKDQILFCDMVITPSNWERNGKKGISGYLNILHVKLKEDRFKDKYEETFTPENEGDVQ